MGHSSPEDILSWDNLIYLADFFEKSGCNYVSLLGGEPLLHPEISEFILYLNSRGIASTVFTSGIAPDKKYEALTSKLSDFRDLALSFVCNVNDPEDSPARELEKVTRFLDHFQEKVCLSFNVYKTDFKYDFLIDYINRYNLERNIRLGLAHPIPGKPNNCISPDKFAETGDRISMLCDDLAKEGITLGLDCGFPVCMFTEEQIGRLFLNTLKKLDFTCGPAIDIGPNMDVWSCFPLSEYNKRSIYDFSSMKELYDYFDSSMSELREGAYLYDKCPECSYLKRGLCSGGCISHILNKKGK